MESDPGGLHKEAFQDRFPANFQPTTNPQHAMSCTISAYFGGPRGFISHAGGRGGSSCDFAAAVRRPGSFDCFALPDPVVRRPALSL